MDLPSVEDGDAACAALPRPRASDVAQTRLKTRSDEPSERVSSEKRRILVLAVGFGRLRGRSEEHTSELQSLMRTSYADFCLKKTQSTHITVMHTTNRKQPIALA